MNFKFFLISLAIFCSNNRTYAAANEKRKEDEIIQLLERWEYKEGLFMDIRGHEKPMYVERKKGGVVVGPYALDFARTVLQIPEGYKLSDAVENDLANYCKKHRIKNLKREFFYR